MFTKRWVRPACMNILVKKVHNPFPSKIVDGCSATLVMEVPKKISAIRKKTTLTTIKVIVMELKGDRWFIFSFFWEFF